MIFLEIGDVPARHPATLFHEFWQSNLNDLGVLDRSRLNPMKMPGLLPWMGILKRVSKTPEEMADPNLPDWQRQRDYWFIYGLCGTGYVQLIGQDLTGKSLGASQRSEGALESYIKVEKTIELGVPQITQLGMPVEGRDFIKVIRAAFPASSSGKEIDQIVSVVAPVDCKISD
jgi:hypothetical protein